MTDRRTPADLVAVVLAQAHGNGWELDNTAQLSESKSMTKAIGGKRGDLKVFTGIGGSSLVTLDISLH